MKTPSCSNRHPCDDYCPIESCVSCGLPEYADIRLGLLCDPPIVWACHSNDKLPCTSTGLVKFPEKARVFSDPKLFFEALDQDANHGYYE